MSQPLDIERKSSFFTLPYQKSSDSSRSQTIYGSLVETFGPYLQDYTSGLYEMISAILAVLFKSVNANKKS